MGLFDFVRGIGKKVFSHDEEAAEKIKTEIEAANPGVSDLDVHYEPQSGTVALSGQATSAEAMQKAVLMAGELLRVGAGVILGFDWERIPLNSTYKSKSDFAFFLIK